MYKQNHILLVLMKVATVCTILFNRHTYTLYMYVLLEGCPVSVYTWLCARVNNNRVRHVHEYKLANTTQIHLQKQQNCHITV